VSLRRLAAILLCAGLLPLGGGCGRGPSVPPGGPHAVILIVIDTLRADRLGCYGHADAVTPNLDRLAAGGTRFADCSTPVPVTLPAMTSLLTGLWPHRHGVRDNAGFVLDGTHPTLPEDFAAAGWRTGAVVGAAVLAADRGLDRGFERYVADFDCGFRAFDPVVAAASDSAAAECRADVVTDRALELAREFGDGPYFLLVHYFDVHAPYDPPPRYARLHPGRPYDGEISFVDHEIGRLLAGLDGPRRPLVVVVADHGEGLGEHGEDTHGFLLHGSTLRVPLIVRGPGVPAGARRDEPVCLTDLAPTLAAAAGLAPADAREAPEPDGLVLDWSRPRTGPRLLYAETFRTLCAYGWSHLRALREGRWKLIAGPRDELYDLAADPGETSPLAPDAAEAVRLSAALAEMVRDDDPAAVLRAARDDPDQRRREILASLGYVGEGEPSADFAALPHPADMLPAMKARLKNQARFHEARHLYEEGDLAGARAKLDTFLNLNPDLADAWHNRGLILEALGETEAAQADYVRALAVDPQFVPTLEKRSAHLLRAGHLERAIPLLERLAALRPEDVALRFNLGMVAYRVGRPALAVRHLERFLELAPQHPQAGVARQALATLEAGD
jgi:choline-sulfatase